MACSKFLGVDRKFLIREKKVFFPSEGKVVLPLRYAGPSTAQQMPSSPAAAAIAMPLVCRLAEGDRVTGRKRPLCGRLGPLGRFGAARGAVLVQFCCFRAPQFPVSADLAWECPGMRSEAFVSAALEILPSQHDLNSAHLVPFCLI